MNIDKELVDHVSYVDFQLNKETQSKERIDITFSESCQGRNFVKFHVGHEYNSFTYINRIDSALINIAFN